MECYAHCRYAFGCCLHTKWDYTEEMCVSELTLSQHNGLNFTDQNSLKIKNPLNVNKTPEKMMYQNENKTYKNEKKRLTIK